MKKLFVISLGGSLIVPEEIDAEYLKRFRTLIIKQTGKGKRFSIVVVAEGAKPKGGDVVVQRIVKESSDPIRLGGIGFILGDQIEINLVRSIMTDANPWLFVTRPISGAMLALSVGSVIFALWQHRRSQRRAAQATEPDVDF